MVQWLRLCASTAGGTASIPDQGSFARCAVQQKNQKTKNKKRERERDEGNKISPDETKFIFYGKTRKFKRKIVLCLFGPPPSPLVCVVPLH